MLISVIYQDDTHDLVKPFLLNKLLAAGKVKRFLCSDGWAVVGVSPMRRNDLRTKAMRWKGGASLSRLFLNTPLRRGVLKCASLFWFVSTGYPRQFRVSMTISWSVESRGRTSSCI